VAERVSTLAATLGTGPGNDSCGCDAGGGVGRPGAGVIAARLAGGAAPELMGVGVGVTIGAGVAGMRLPARPSTVDAPPQSKSKFDAKNNAAQRNNTFEDINDSKNQRRVRPILEPPASQKRLTRK
jgi:hypothetical protein